MKKLIETLASGMSRARNNSDGQTKSGYILLPVQDYDALYHAAYSVKKELERISQPPLVTLTIDRNDLGQAIDGLRVRAEQYEDAVRHFNGEIVLSEIPECDDAEEAQAIAEHYRKIIAVMEAATHENT